MPVASAALAGRIVRGSALSLAAGFVARAAGMAQSIVIARGLGPYRVGVFSVLSYVLSVAGALADLGLPVAAMKLVSESQARSDRALKRVLLTVAATTVATAALGALALFGTADPLAALYGEPALSPLFRLGAAALFLSVLGSLLTGALQGFQRIDVLALAGPTKAVTMLVVTVALLPTLGLPAIVLASVTAEVVGGVVASRPLYRAIAPHWSPEPAAPSWAVLRRALHLAVPALLSALALWTVPWLVRSYVAYARGYAELGLFQVADALSRVLLLLPGALAVPFVPAVSELSAAAPVRLPEVAQAALRVTLLVTLPGALFVFLAARPLLVLVYGAPYGEAGLLLALLALAAFLQSASVIVWSVLVGVGRMWTGLAIQVGGHVLLLGLTVALVPAFGPGGLGTAHLAAAAAVLGAGLATLRRGLGLPLDRLGALLPAALAGWTAAAALAAAGAGGLGAALVMALGIAAWEHARLTEEERQWLHRLAGRLRARGV